jgi:hypothetical protein
MVVSKDRSCPFTLSVPANGAPMLDVACGVRKLPGLTAIPGPVAQGRPGFAPDDLCRGNLWLRNETGVIMQLRASSVTRLLSPAAMPSSP